MSNQQTQAPSSPSWSVPLHRPPPGVVYDQQPPTQFGNYAYPPPPPSHGIDQPESSSSSGWMPDQYSDTHGQGTWYPPPHGGSEFGYGAAVGTTAGLSGYSTYPPSGPSTSYTPSTSRRDTLPHAHPPFSTGHDQSHGRANSLSMSTSHTPDVIESKGGSASKKKRKKGSPAGETEKEKEKRTKTGRACDACRTKKIRCDILSKEDADAMGREALCAHCKQYDLECTFFLPITETRFKKKRQTGQSPQVPAHQADEVEDLGAAPSMQLNESATIPAVSRSPGREISQRPQDIPARLEGDSSGPTSLSFLLHTALPASSTEAYDLRNHNKWEISEDGNGLIRVNAPPTATGYADADPDDPSRQHNRLNKPILNAHTISLLVNAYFEHLAPLFPVVSRADFAAKANPSPLLLYSICGLAATMRHVPREVFAGVRGVINGLLRSNDILSDARFEHVQALLLLGQAGDLHAQPTAATASASLIRMGTATRMAQDLGLHRESNIRAQTPQDLAYVELRRRVWSSCVIFDRWYGAALGIPLLVDLCDCDVLLPAPYEIIPENDPSTWVVEPSYMALAEHLKLSILVGRVLKMIYSPTGLKHATDEQLESLLADMEGWLLGLPEQLQYRGPESSHAAGLLHMGHCALQFLFWRVFMRITYTCPPHLTVHLKTEKWSQLVQWSREAIDWLHHNDVVLDTLFIYPYTATNAALIQYHTWARRKDPAALDALKIIKDVASGWERKVQPDQMSIRRKTCETMTLLYEAALKTTSPGPGMGAGDNDTPERPSGVNPTAGVRMREEFGQSVFVPDSTKPGGGIWVAKSRDEKLNAGILAQEVVLNTEYQPGSQTELQSQDPDETPSHLPYNGQVADSAVPNNINGSGPEITGGPNEILQSMQMNAANVNPNMNLNPEYVDMAQMQAGDGQDGMQGLAGQDLFINEQNAGFDETLLEGLPLNQFNWNEWNTYFENLNNVAGPAPVGDNGNGQAGHNFARLQ